MKKINLLFMMALMLPFLLSSSPRIVLAATSPSLGNASYYGILADTYTNTSAGTTINASIGFTTGPAVLPGGTHIYYGPGAPYAAAGADQATALSALNSQACTFTFADGAIDLASDTTLRPDPIGVYSPGVYCANGAVSIGTAGITLKGSGTYIFRMTGALNTVDNSAVVLDGASACDIFWTPGAATTLGDNSTFIGTNINDSGITIGSNVDWTGQALAFGGTITSTLNDTITLPVCSSSPTASLTLVKTVVNDDGGTKLATDFPLFIGTTTVLSGAITTLIPGDYIVSETNLSGYTASTWTGDCSANGEITLLAGDVKVCNITNNDNPLVVLDPVSSGGSSIIIPRIQPIISIIKTAFPSILTNGPATVTYTYNVSNPGTVEMRDIRVSDDKCSNVAFVSGDSNNSNLLETNETWVFRCSSYLNQTTTNIATVRGYDYGGLLATDMTNATVIVSGSASTTQFIETTAGPMDPITATTTQIIPGLPNTGSGGVSPINNSWYFVIIVGAISSLFILYLAKQRSN